jgi:hypothetical protein
LLITLTITGIRVNSTSVPAEKLVVASGPDIERIGCKIAGPIGATTVLRGGTVITIAITTIAIIEEAGRLCARTDQREKNHCTAHHQVDYNRSPAKMTQAFFTHSFSFPDL